MLVKIIDGLMRTLNRLVETQHSWVVEQWSEIEILLEQVAETYLNNAPRFGCWKTLGTINYLIRRYEKALPYFTYCLELRQDIYSLWGCLADCLLALGDAERAVFAYTKSLELKPGDDYLEKMLKIAIKLSKE